MVSQSRIAGRSGRRRAAGAFAVAALLAVGGCSADQGSGGATSTTTQPTAGSGTSGGTSTTSGATGAGGTTSTSATVVSRIGVPYVPGAGKSQQLDLFTPGESVGAQGPRPLLVFVHGGGWWTGDKEVAAAGGGQLVSPLTDLLLSKGYAVASVNYRLSGEAAYPANIHDVNAAIRYLRANAEDLGLDPERFALGGESAGAHLSLLAGVTAGEPAYDGTLGTTGVDTKVRAVVSYYGLSDLRDRAALNQAAGCGARERSGPSSEGRMFGADPASDQGKTIAAAASPLLHVKAGAPPVIMLAGESDCTAPPRHSTLMDQALKAKGIQSSVMLLPVGHGDAQFFAGQQAQEAVVGFLDEHLSD